MWFPHVMWQMSHLYAILSQILLIMSTSVVTTASVIRASSSSKLAGRGGTKTLSLMYPHTEKSRGVKSVIVATCSALVCNSMMTGRICKQLCTSGMPSGSSNENLRTRRNLWNVPDQIVTSSSEVKDRICKQLCTSGMPSGSSNENLRTRRNLWNVPEQIVTSSSEVNDSRFWYN